MEYDTEAKNAGEESYPLEVGVDAGDEVDLRDDDVSERQDNGGGATKKEENFIVSLHGLPYSASLEDIANFLEGCILVGGNSGIHFVYGDDGRPNGDAFAELATEEDLKIALSKNRKHIGKRYIDVYQIDRYEMEYILKRSGSDGTGDKTDLEGSDTVVRLRGLPFTCTKEEIATFFLGLPISPNGIIIVKDGQGRAAGDGYVQFTSPESVDRALEKHKEKIGHRYIEVFRSNSVEMQKRGRPPPLMSTRPGPYDRPGFRNPYAGRSRMRGFDDYDRYGRYDRFGGGFGRPDRDGYGGGRDRFGGMGFGGRARGTHVVYMRGLPYSANEHDVLKFFSPIEPLHIDIELTRAGRASGDAAVEFESESDVREAMKRHRETIGHRYIELSASVGFRR